MDNTKAQFAGILQKDKRNMNVKLEGEKTQQYFCAIIASIGAFIIGSVLAWTSPGLEYLKHTNYSAPFQITPDEGNWIAAWMPLGAILGAIPAGMVADSFGRQSLLVTCTIPWIGSWILTITAKRVFYLYAARFIAGIICGLFCTVLPMYINEIAENSIRGTLGTLFGLFFTAGILCDYTLALSNSYIVLGYSLLGVTVAFFFIVMFMPETPTYYMKKRRRDEAEKSLRRLRGPHYDVQRELTEIRKNLGTTSTTRQPFSVRMLSKKANAKALIISIGLMLCQQFSGINVIIFFAGTIFKEAGDSSPVLCAIIVGKTHVLATVAYNVLVDRAGRKILLLVSSASMSICLAALGYYFLQKETQDENAAKNIYWLPLASVVLFIIAFSIGLGPLPWMMSGEVLGSEIKSFGTAATVVAHWTCMSLTTFFFLPLTKSITNAYTFWLFSAWCAFTTVFVLVFLPETKGKSLEEIQNILAGKKPSQATNVNV